MWIQRPLDALHNPDGIQAQLLDEEFFLSQPNPVFALRLLSMLLRSLSGRPTYRTRSFHLQGSLDHIADAFLNGIPLCRVSGVVQDAFVKVAIPNMAQDAGEEPQIIHFPLRDFFTMLGR